MGHYRIINGVLDALRINDLLYLQRAGLMTAGERFAEYILTYSTENEF
jgi:hypothetical protein